MAKQAIKKSPLSLDVL